MQKFIVLGAIALILLTAYAFYGFRDDSGVDLGGADGVHSGPEFELENEGAVARRNESDEDPSALMDRPLPDEDERPSAATTRSGLSGTLIHETTKVAVVGAQVRYVDIEGREVSQAKSDAKGRFLMPLPESRPEGHLRASTDSLCLEPRLMPALMEPLIEELGLLSLAPSVNIVGTVVNEEGKGLAGARVELYPHTMFDMMNFDIVSLLKSITSEDPPLLATSTDDQGQFRFEEVAARDWVTAAIKEGYATGFSLPFKAGKVAAEEIRIKLPKSVEFSGKVQDTAGLPLSHIRILAISEELEPDSAMRTVKTTSGVDGKFNFADVGEGGLQLIARGKGYVSQTQLRATAPSNELIVVMEKSGKIHGKVTNLADDSPLAGVEVLGMQMQSGSFEIVHSDAEGQYVLEDMPRSGEVMVLANFAGFAMKKDPPQGNRGFDMPGIHVPESLLVTGNAEVDIGMSAGTKVSGQVVDRMTGLGIPGAKVKYMGSNGGFGTLGLGRLEATTDEQGQFEISGLPAGRFALLASKTGYFRPRDEEASDLIRLYDSERPAGLEVVEGQELTGVQLKLVTGLTCEGRVVDNMGKPVLGARIRCRREVESEDEDGEDWRTMQFWGSSEGSVLSDAEGRFLIPGLEPHQSYSLGAQHKNFPCSERPIVRFADKQLDEVVIKLLSPGSLKGRVMRTDGSPAVKLAVHIYVSTTNDDLGFDSGSGFEHDRQAETDLNGRFEFPNLPPGEHSFWINEDSDYRLVDEDNVAIHIESGQTKQFEVKVTETVFIEGLVVDEKGIAIENVWVSAGKMDAPREEGSVERLEDSSDYTGPDGRFRLNRLNADTRYAVSAKSWKFDPDAGSGASEDETPRSFKVIILTTIDDVEAGTSGLRLQVKRADVGSDF